MKMPSDATIFVKVRSVIESCKTSAQIFTVQDWIGRLKIKSVAAVIELNYSITDRLEKIHKERRSLGVQSNPEIEN